MLICTAHGAMLPMHQPSFVFYHEFLPTLSFSLSYVSAKVQDAMYSVNLDAKNKGFSDPSGN